MAQWLQAQTPGVAAILEKQRSIKPLDLSKLGGETGLLLRSLGGNRGNQEFAPFLLRPSLQVGCSVRIAGEQSYVRLISCLVLSVTPCACLCTKATCSTATCCSSTARMMCTQLHADRHAGWAA